MSNGNDKGSVSINGKDACTGHSLSMFCIELENALEHVDSAKAVCKSSKF